MRFSKLALILTFAFIARVNCYGQEISSVKAQQPVSNLIMRDDFRLAVEQVIPLKLSIVTSKGWSVVKDTTVYQLYLRYQVKKGQALTIDRIGTFENTGTTKLLYDRPNLTLRLSNDKKTMNLPLAVTETTMSSNPVEIPQIDDFPKAYKEFVIKDPLTFERNLRKAVNERSAYGLLASQQGSIFYIHTPFIKLYDVGTQFTNGQISMQISYYYKDASNPQTYRITFIARENKTHDLKWRSPSESVLSSAARFVEQVVKSLN